MNGPSLTMFGLTDDEGGYQLREADYPHAITRGDQLEWPGVGEVTVTGVSHYPWGEEGHPTAHRYVRATL